MRTNPNAIIADRLNDAVWWRERAGMASGRNRLEFIRRAIRAIDGARYFRQQRQREADNYDEEHFGFGWLADREASIRRRLSGPAKKTPFDEEFLSSFTHQSLYRRYLGETKEDLSQATVRINTATRKI